MAINMNAVRKIAKSKGVNEKIEEVKEDIKALVEKEFESLFTQLGELENLLQDILSQESPSSEMINRLCKDYVAINAEIKKIYRNVINDNYLYKVDKIKDVFEIYIISCYEFCGSHQHIAQEAFKLCENFNVTMCKLLLQLMRENTEIIIDETEHLDKGLDYVFKTFVNPNKDDDNDDTINKLLDEIKEVKKEIKYIFTYKADCNELIRLAEENGYKFVNQTGSHKKFEHKLTKKCVTIPCHSYDLGKGISFAIQKQIVDNSK